MRIVKTFIFLLSTASLVAWCQGQDDWRFADNYDKTEHRIEMRDGVHLHTTVYTPKDRSEKYPIMLNRTCYSSQPYGPRSMPGRIGPSTYMEKGEVHLRETGCARPLDVGREIRQTCAPACAGRRGRR